MENKNKEEKKPELMDKFYDKIISGMEGKLIA